MLNARRALVTGGAGFIGSHLVDRLVEDGWSVRILDDFSTGRLENLDRVRDRVEIVNGDLCDRVALGEALEEAEVVFHQAAIPSVIRSVEDPIGTHRVNVLGTLQLLQLAREASVRRVVFAASCAAYGDGEELPKRESLPARPISPYALQKHAGELYCRLFAELYGLETVALRYFNVFGPRQDPNSDYAAVVPRFITSCLAGRPPRIYGDGEQTRDFVHVDDVVRANLLALDTKRAVGRVVNVGSGLQTNLNELLARIQEVTGTRIEPIHESPRAGEARHAVADLTRARRWLEYEPSVSLYEGLRSTVEAFATTGKKVKA